MASNRHLGRIIAFQTLYEYDFRGAKKSGLTIDEIRKRNLKQYERVIDDTKFVEDLVAHHCRTPVRISLGAAGFYQPGQFDLLATRELPAL